jgi:hypothetical protein
LHGDGGRDRTNWWRARGEQPQLTLRLWSTVPALRGVTQTIQRENGIYYLALDGSPYDNGLMHGRVLTEEIRHSIVDYRMNVEKTFGREHAPRII